MKFCEPYMHDTGRSGGGQPRTDFLLIGARAMTLGG